MTGGTIYTDPYSGHEILVLEVSGPSTGASYDPRRSDLPTAWTSSCTHCQNKRFRDVPIHVKHQIWMMMHARGGGFVPSTRSQILELTVPTVGEPHVLRCWSDSQGTHAHVVADGQIIVRASQCPGDKIIYETPERLPDRKLLHRALKFVFSKRTATPRDIAAVAAPLAERQQAKAKSCGYRNACDKIDWLTILRQTSSTQQVA